MLAGRDCKRWYIEHGQLLTFGEPKGLDQVRDAQHSISNCFGSGGISVVEEVECEWAESGTNEESVGHSMEWVPSLGCLACSAVQCLPVGIRLRSGPRYAKTTCLGPPRACFTAPVKYWRKDVV